MAAGRVKPRWVHFFHTQRPQWAAVVDERTACGKKVTEDTPEEITQNHAEVTCPRCLSALRPPAP